MLKTKRKRKPALSDDKWREVLRYSREEFEATPIDFVNLVFALGLPGAENLDVLRCQDTLDKWAQLAKREISRNRHRFAESQRRHGDTWEQWQIGMLITVLQQDCGVTYNPALRNDYSFEFFDSQDVFIHGMIPGPHGDAAGGTCASLPILYCAVARRLGFPLKLLAAEGHLAMAWVDPQRGKLFNVEGSSRGFSFPDDAHYLGKSGMRTSADFIGAPAPGRRAKVPPRVLAFKDELAQAMATRAHVLLDNLRCEEAAEAYQYAVRMDRRFLNFWRLAEAMCGRPHSPRWVQEAAHKRKKLQSGMKLLKGPNHV